MISIKFLTHSLLLENIYYIIKKGAVVPKKRYQYMKYRVFGLSINGSYAYFANSYIAHVVFPAKIVSRYSIKPVLYTNYEITRTMIPSRDRSVYYYNSKLAFEMELVSESAIPLYEAEAVYVSRYAIHSDLIDKLKKFCREHGIPVEYGTPIDEETFRMARKLLNGDSKTIDQYNRTVCQCFNVDYRIPSEEEMIELLRYWKAW